MNSRLLSATPVWPLVREYDLYSLVSSWIEKGAEQKQSFPSNQQLCVTGWCWTHCGPPPAMRGRIQVALAHVAMSDIGPGTADVEHVTAVPLAGHCQAMQGHNMGVRGKLLASRNVSQWRGRGPQWAWEGSGKCLRCDVQKQQAMSPLLLLRPIQSHFFSLTPPPSCLLRGMHFPSVPFFPPSCLFMVFKLQMLTISLSLTFLWILEYECE